MVPAGAHEGCMVGKNPHRPEGKAHADNERMQAAWMSGGFPHSHPSEKEVYQRDLQMQAESGGPTQYPAEEQLGGSRPGVESRVKDAIARRGEREEEAG